MLKNVVTAAVALILCNAAEGNLGDVYEMSCHRYGLKPTLETPVQTKGIDNIMFGEVEPGVVVTECFKDNVCVEVSYSIAYGTPIPFNKQVLTKLMNINLPYGDKFHVYAKGNDAEYYVNQDKTIYARVAIGWMRIATKDFLLHHSLFYNEETKDAQLIDNE